MLSVEIQILFQVECRHYIPYLGSILVLGNTWSLSWSFSAECKAPHIYQWCSGISLLCGLSTYWVKFLVCVINKGDDCFDGSFILLIYRGRLSQHWVWALKNVWTQPMEYQFWIWDAQWRSNMPSFILKGHVRHRLYKYATWTCRSHAYANS